MEVKEKQVTLRKLVASEGNIIISKLKDEEGNPVVRAKEIYLATGDSEENYEEIEEVNIEKQEE